MTDRSQRLSIAMTICLRPFAAVLAAGAFAALVHGVLTNGRDASGLAEFFGYFTTQSGLLSITMLLLLAVLNPVGPTWQLLFCAATTYSLLACLVWEWLLTDVPLDLTHDLPNVMLHKLLPVGMLIVWLLHDFRDGGHVSLRWAFAFPGYPLAYVLMVLCIGDRSGWYPYPFLNPNGGTGYWGLLSQITQIVACLFAIGVTVIGSGWGRDYLRGRQRGHSTRSVPKIYA